MQRGFLGQISQIECEKEADKRDRSPEKDGNVAMITF
jgi:hypothetical protein